MNKPTVKVGIVAVSRDCFPESLSVTRRQNLVNAYKAKYNADEIYECPVCIVESEIHMMQALDDIKKAGCNALCVYLGNFGPEISETMLAQYFDGPKMFVAAAEETSENGGLVQGRGDAYCGMLNASYNLKLRNIHAYIPEYPVGTAEECAENSRKNIFIKAMLRTIKDRRYVVHGRWLEDDGVQICSNCGEEHEWADYRALWCDCCGAKMDLDEKEGDTE